jgi:hypothetical protein
MIVTDIEAGRKEMRSQESEGGRAGVRCRGRKGVRRQKSKGKSQKAKITAQKAGSSQLTTES